MKRRRCFFERFAVGALLISAIALPRVVAAVEVAAQGGAAASNGQTPPRWYSDSNVAAGASVYRAHCASCHGREGEGHPQWRRRDADGKFPPPPLNGTGHAWHHPAAALMHVIMKGSPGGGNMPAWEGVLSAEDAASVIAWFQSKWPDEIYAAWHRIQAQSRN